MNPSKATLILIREQTQDTECIIVTVESTPFGNEGTEDRWHWEATRYYYGGDGAASPWGWSYDRESIQTRETTYAPCQWVSYESCIIGMIRDVTELFGDWKIEAVGAEHLPRWYSETL